MERRTSVHPHPSQDIVPDQQHSRRDFLVRAGRTTASSLTAAALFESPRFDKAQAQQTRRPASGRRPQRVAVVGAGEV